MPHLQGCSEPLQAHSSHSAHGLPGTAPWPPPHAQTAWSPGPRQAGVWLASLCSRLWALPWGWLAAGLLQAPSAHRGCLGPPIENSMSRRHYRTVGDKGKASVRQGENRNMASIIKRLCRQSHGSGTGIELFLLCGRWEGCGCWLESIRRRRMHRV